MKLISAIFTNNFTSKKIVLFFGKEFSDTIKDSLQNDKIDVKWKEPSSFLELNNYFKYLHTLMKEQDTNLQEKERK